MVPGRSSRVRRVAVGDATIRPAGSCTRIGDLLLEQVGELATLETLDNGKPLAVATAPDVPLAADLFYDMSGWTTKLNGQTISVSVPHMPGAQFTPTRWRAGRVASTSSRGTSCC